MKTRLKWGAIGLAYAFVYGLVTGMATGGGHGNFLWVVLFLFAYFFGLFFPAMGYLIADLRPLWAKSAGIAICLISILLTIVQLTSLGTEGNEDVVRSWERSPVSFIFVSIIHFLPLIVFIVLIVRSFRAESESSFEETTIP